MKYLVAKYTYQKVTHSVLLSIGVLCSQNIWAQGNIIYRCENNEYTNNVKDATARGCKKVEGGNVTVIASQPVRRPAAATTSTSGSKPVPVAAASDPEQRSRDSDAKAILQGELEKAKARHAELLKEYNNGEPEKQGAEARNYQKYLDRVAQLKENITRTESDIASIEKELKRRQ